MIDPKTPSAESASRSQRGLLIAAIALAVLAVVGIGVLVGMSHSPSSGETSTAESASGGIGSPIEFRRADSGELIGTITIRDSVLVPAECVIDPVAGTAGLAIQVEIDNSGTVGIGSPDMYTLTTLHRDGITHPTENGVLKSSCSERWPSGKSADVGLRTSQWILLHVQQDPIAVQYTPIVAAPGSTWANLELVATAPKSVTIPLPATMSTAAMPTATAATTPSTPAASATTQAPPPTKTAVAPAAGVACDPDVDNWATDASGGQLKCAYAGGPTPKWVNSAPLIGTRTPGTPCRQGEGVAESPSGQTLVCAGMSADTSVWTPGP
ncbi:hypothetical protein [Nocardia rhizosphaerae]|uniref:DUF4352 domain-containing protein n=1 Tax=Nocardia rhizosphaerae TaxID=1691571 RepID=A0ABV8L2P4_9NOCA